MVGDKGPPRSMHYDFMKWNTICTCQKAVTLDADLYKQFQNDGSLSWNGIIIIMQ